MIVRPARREDAAAICALWNPIIRDTLVTFTTEAKTVAAVAAAIAAHGDAWWVGEIQGRVQGVATFGAFRSGPGYAATAEHSIQLAPAARGQGLGRALMAVLLELARAQGLHVMVAGISGANPGAVAFHAALGFAEVGRLPQVGRKAGQWLDLILMQKILSDEVVAGPDSGAGLG